MAEFEWPDDPEFRRVAARIADAVTVHINTGGRIVTGPSSRSGDPDCRCPIGCVYPNGARFPFYDAPSILGVDAYSAREFIEVFDGVWSKPRTAYGHLAVAYRRRFVERVR